MVWEESTDLCESSQAEKADREARLRGPDSSADSSHTTRPFPARFSPRCPWCRLSLEPGPIGKTDLFARLNDWSSLAHCSPEPADQRAGSLVPAGG